MNELDIIQFISDQDTIKIGRVKDKFRAGGWDKYLVKELDNPDVHIVSPARILKVYHVPIVNVLAIIRENGEPDEEEFIKDYEEHQKNQNKKNE